MPIAEVRGKRGVEVKEVRDTLVIWRTPQGAPIVSASIRDGKLVELPPIFKESIERDIDGCITFLKKIKENII